MNKNDKSKDKLQDENLNKTINEGNSVPNIHPTGKRQDEASEEEIRKGKVILNNVILEDAG